MARAAIVLVALAAIGAARVELARREDRARHEVHRRLSDQVVLRRRLWDQRTRIGQLLAPEQVKRRAAEMTLDLTSEDESRSFVADGGRGG